MFLFIWYCNKYIFVWYIYLKKGYIKDGEFFIKNEGGGGGGDYMVLD